MVLPGTQYNNGVTNQYAGNNTTLTFDVPMNAPNVLYYQCTSHGNMGGPIYIADAADYLTAESDTLATVTGRGATTSTAVEFSNTTNSTSKTTGAVKIGGGLGVLTILMVEILSHYAIIRWKIKR